MRRGLSIHREIGAVAALLHIIDTSRLLKLLKEDDCAIFTAAAKASEAVSYLKGLQAPEPEPPNAPRRTNGPGGAQLG